MIQITDNFYQYEFMVSADYPELAKKIIITEVIYNRLKLLCQSILQPVRDKHGGITILSGVRSKELNIAINGYYDSDHVYGNASDIYPGYDNLVKVFKDIKNNYPCRQVIYYPEDLFIHVSQNIPGRVYKHESMIYEKGIYRYV